MNPIEQVLSDPNLLRYILLRADYDTIISYCQSYHQAKDICRDQVFWRQRAQLEMGVTPEVFYATGLSPLQSYILLLTMRGGLVKGSEKYIGPFNFAKRVLRMNNRKLFDYIVTIADGSRWDWNELLTIAVGTGDISLAKYVKSVAPEGYRWRPKFWKY